MQRRVSNVFVAVVATFLLVLAAISPASADVGVRVAPRTIEHRSWNPVRYG
jgi:hypothetical protein